MQDWWLLRQGHAAAATASERSILPTTQLERVHYRRDKPEPRLGPAQALHDRLSAIPQWRLSGDETVISRELC